ncbi:MAG: hypothetical protein RLZZ42_217 [Bacteroidota bacterium]
MRYRCLVVLLMLFILGCEKDINIKLDPSENKLVVEASIENGTPPFVILTKSLDFFNKIDPSRLQASFVKNAIVTINDGNNSVVLQPDSLKSDEGATVYFYTDKRMPPILGKLNAAYQLSIKYEGKEYTSRTTIPSITRTIDSVWWEKLPSIEPRDSVFARVLLRATDKPGLGDYIRYYTKVGAREPFLPGFNSVFDDQIIDGKSYTIPVDRGFNRNAEFTDSSSFYRRGDTVTIKLCQIDKATYDFWRTYEFSFQSIGNPFSSPTRILSNISNEALGYFGGYGCQFRTIIIPK